MKYFKYLVLLSLLAGFVLPARTLAAPPSSFLQGGNSFGVQATLGTNDNNLLVLKTNDTPRITLYDNRYNSLVGFAGDIELLQSDASIYFGNGSPDDFLAYINYDSTDGDGGLALGTHFGRGAILVSSSGNHTVIGDAFNFPKPEGTLQVVNGSGNSTIYIGSAGVDPSFTQRPGCLVLGDSDGVGVTYVTANDGVLTASATKPSICD